MCFEDIRGKMVLLFAKERETFAQFRREKERANQETKEKEALKKDHATLLQKYEQEQKRGDDFEKTISEQNATLNQVQSDVKMLEKRLVARDCTIETLEKEKSKVKD